ncbi:hypothetical protein [Leptolyngbya sp. FACHB-261]|uniref:hypothetical protein n=1 Tax=Leptolyngbya sp. FACHB-261 TaxID=2692806 RepID=UPI001682FC6F|nr:hypothetical protein [Leptolyngbya sp. FACHB-261]MBD2099441.1 hypothetical protein [Leptolyngbya sp. FACHB-261]
MRDGDIKDLHAVIRGYRIQRNTRWLAAVGTFVICLAVIFLPDPLRKLVAAMSLPALLMEGLQVTLLKGNPNCRLVLEETKTPVRYGEEQEV